MSDHGALIAERIAEVQATIAAAAAHADRPSDAITLIAVTKTYSAPLVAAAASAGIKNVGENRVQETEEKQAQLAADPPLLRWHLIGPLQRNKARKAATLFQLIHSVDSLALAATLDRHRANDAPTAERLPILVQINLAAEPQKAGFVLRHGLDDQANLAAFYAMVEAILALPQLQLQGLMTVPPYHPDPEQSRPYFRQLAALRTELARRYPEHDWQHLSMGMSNDLAVAVEEGASLVRVGTAIFGARG